MSLLKTEAFEAREYQKNIAETAAKKNTLVVLPTGLGKTLISVLVAAKRLEEFPDGKVLICSPTRPLSAQHKKSFEKFTNIPEEEIILVTGRIRPEDRVELYTKARIVIATPQTIQNDLEAGRLNLENFVFVTLDEAHRAVKEYSYPYIAKKYMLQSKFPLILGLTASPGGSYKRIDEICNNLFIKAVEIRSETDLDVKKYVQPVVREFIYIDFPPEFQRIKTLFQETMKEDVDWLKKHHYIPITKPTLKMLLELQRKITEKYMQGSKNYSLIWAMIKVATVIKIEHALELLETQGISFLYDYLKKLEASKKKADRRITKDPKVREAVRLVEVLYSKGIEHPKLEKTLNVVKDILREKANSKIIIFANYRATVDRIKELLLSNGIESEILIGQTTKDGKGLTQQEQIEILKRFSKGDFNVLCTTSIGEEGLDIAATDVAIFYEAVPSEIRAIQRRGRVGRQTCGKIIFLITKDTRDEAYYFAALRKEKKMRGILYDMKERGIKKPKITLLDWVK